MTDLARAKRAIDALRKPDASLARVPNTIRDSIAEVIEDLAAQVENAGWQPIETAPKDGRAIQLVHGKWQTVGSWHRNHQCWVASAPVYAPYPADEQPTHWALLRPEPLTKHPTE